VSASASTRPPGRVFALSLALVALITPLAVHLFMPVIPEVKAALDLSHAGAQLTFSVSLFGMAFATLVYGSLSDRYGRRPVLLAGLALFLIGSAISALAPTATALVLGRLVQALGAGCGLPLVRAIARDAYRADQLVKAIAYLTMFGTLGPMLAPIIGGALIDTLGWRSTFAFAVLAGAAIATVAHLQLYETHPAAGRTVSGGALEGYIALVARLRFNAFVLQSGLTTGAFMVMATASASLMSELLNRPATEFGLYFTIFPLGFATGSLIATRIGQRLSTETMVLTGSFLALAAVSGQALVLLHGIVVPLTFFLPGFFLTLAQGIAMPYGQAAAMAEIPRFAGTAAGIGVFMQHLCAAVFAQLYGFLADGTPRPMVAIAVFCGVLVLVAGAIPAVLKRRGERPAAPAGPNP
jgi:DHA1 family bicyclomycin/chloramphenicol resistance-like MFS transporter